LSEPEILSELNNSLTLFGRLSLDLMLFAQVASAGVPIRTEVISGGEVEIGEVNARKDRGKIVVSGTGFEIFPGRTCGYPEVAFVDANRQILFRKSAVYTTSYWVRSRNPFRDRLVSFSVSVPESPAVTSVFVRHQSTGGCEHAWSLQYALDWLLYKMRSRQENKTEAYRPPVGNVEVGKAAPKDRSAPSPAPAKE
jgi:hypothetical protein